MSAPVRDSGHGPSKDRPLNYASKKVRHAERDPVPAGAYREGDAARQNPALESGQPPWKRSNRCAPFVGDIAAAQLRNQLALAPHWLSEPPPPPSTGVKFGLASRFAGVAVATAVFVIGYQLGSAPPASPPELPVRSSKANQPKLASERSVPTNDANLYIQRGTAAYRSGDFLGAIGNFDEAIRLNPDEAQSYNIRGNAWDELGVFERAIADYAQAIRIDPNNPAVFHDRAILWQRKGALDEALVDLDRAVRFTFADANIYCDRGLVWYQKGRHDRAIADFDRAIKLDPNFAAACINRGLILHRNREFNVAFLDTKAIRVDPDVFDVSHRTASGRRAITEPAGATKAHE
jgi:tetratricopeptide (TPR) repeat protein